MIFSSFEFIFLFLPLVIIGYFQLSKLISHFWGKLFLVAASLFFYGYWNPEYVVLIVGSCLINFKLGSHLIPGVQAEARSHRGRRALLIAGIIGNLLLLGFFKYFNFIIFNLKWHGSGKLDTFVMLPPQRSERNPNFQTPRG